MNIRQTVLQGGVLSVLILVAACSNQKLADQKYGARFNDAAQLSDQQFGEPATIRKTNRHLLGDNYTDTAHGDPLPNRVEGPSGFVLTGQATGQLTLQQLQRKVEKYAGITVIIEPSKTPDAGGNASATINGAPVSMKPDGNAVSLKDEGIKTINKLVADSQITMGHADPAMSNRIAEYSGPLSAFLDQNIPKYGTDWDVHGQIIYFGKDIIRSYEVVDMPSATSMSAGLTAALSSASSATASGGATTASGGGSTPGGTSGTGSPGASGGQSSSTTTSINSWKELLATLAGFTGSTGDVFAEPSNGQVTIKCSRYCQGQVKTYISDHNKTAGRSILVTVAIMSVQKTGADDYGFSPTVLYDNLPKGYTISILGQANAATSSTGTTTGATSGSISAGVLNPPANTTAAKFNGTSLALQALSSDEEITGLYHKYALIANNRPYSMRNALDYSYVQSVTTGVGATLATSSAQITTQVVGDQLQIIPRIQGDGTIRLQLAVSRTAIQSINTVVISGTSTTIPQITDNSATPQEFTIRDGATLILADVSDDTSNRITSGTGPTWNWLLGGSANANNNRDKTILIVTAREWHPGDEGPEIPRMTAR